MLPKRSLSILVSILVLLALAPTIIYLFSNIENSNTDTWELLDDDIAYGEQHSVNFSIYKYVKVEYVYNGVHYYAIINMSDRNHPIIETNDSVTYVFDSNNYASGNIAKIGAYASSNQGSFYVASPAYTGNLMLKRGSHYINAEDAGPVYIAETMPDSNDNMLARALAVVLVLSIVVAVVGKLEAL